MAIQGQWVEEEDTLLFDGEPLVKKPPLYFLYHKPKGVLSTMDEDRKNSLYHKLDFKDYVFPVGRLDQDSEGLILLTNDGELAQKILSPKFHHEKEYLVTVNRELTLEFLDKMSEGVDINIGVTRPCEVTRVSDNQFKIILTQGLNRQIRRMSKALGYQVTKLIRLRILNLHLGELPSGEYRAFDEVELMKLKHTLRES